MHNLRAYLVCSVVIGVIYAHAGLAADLFTLARLGQTKEQVEVYYGKPVRPVIKTAASRWAEVATYHTGGLKIAVWYVDGKAVSQSFRPRDGFPLPEEIITSAIAANTTAQTNWERTDLDPDSIRLVRSDKQVLILTVRKASAPRLEIEYIGPSAEMAANAKPGQARLGETQAEIEARYGKAYFVDDRALPGSPIDQTAVYRIGQYTVDVGYLKQKSVLHVFSRSDRGRLTDAELATFLDANATGTSKWRKCGGVEHRWQRANEFAWYDDSLKLPNLKVESAEVWLRLYGLPVQPRPDNSLSNAFLDQTPEQIEARHGKPINRSLAVDRRAWFLEVGLTGIHMFDPLARAADLQTFVYNATPLIATISYFEGKSVAAMFDAGSTAVFPRDEIPRLLEANAAAGQTWKETQIEGDPAWLRSEGGASASLSSAPIECLTLIDGETRARIRRTIDAVRNSPDATSAKVGMTESQMAAIYTKALGQVEPTRKAIDKILVYHASDFDFQVWYSRGKSVLIHIYSADRKPIENSYLEKLLPGQSPGNVSWTHTSPTAMRSSDGTVEVLRGPDQSLTIRSVSFNWDQNQPSASK